MNSESIKLTLENALKKWLKNYCKLVILGIGNPLRKDDDLGSEILKTLKGKVPKNVKLIECQTTPENFTGKMKQFKPSHVMMVDAAHFKAEPGEARLLPPEKISGVALSTHAMPLYMLAEIIQKSTDAKVMLLGVQPKNVDFGEELTPEIQKAAGKIAKVLLDALNKAR